MRNVDPCCIFKQVDAGLYWSLVHLYQDDHVIDNKYFLCPIRRSILHTIIKANNLQPYALSLHTQN